MRARPLSFLSAALVGVALVLASPCALADELGADEVTLKNGGSVRGTVVSSEPGTSVKILVIGDKAPRTIPWSQVTDVERGKFAPKPAATPPGPAGPGYGGPAATLGGPPGAPPPPPMPEAKLGTFGVVRLHIDSPELVHVVEHAHAGTAYGYSGSGTYAVVFDRMTPVCDSPCDKVIDGRSGQKFTLTGEFPEAGPFVLKDKSGDVKLTVKPGSIGLRVGGSLSTTLGGTGVLVGLPLLIVGIASTTSDDLAITGGVVTGVSAAVLTGGILMLVNGATKYVFGSSATPATAMAGGAPRLWTVTF